MEQLSNRPTWKTISKVVSTTATRGAKCWCNVSSNE